MACPFSKKFPCYNEDRSAEKRSESISPGVDFFAW
uniref:Soluble guanylyl cyclase alpha-1 subunit oxide, cyclase, H-NOX, SIGNALING n=1 Tax=Siphoviridae sp. ctUGR26 TaxID=2825527 RepID=A0A8S5Q938_9CAUD|nr:MAG TPA: Soluble guanylyl cyclase alpha-1 subunit oxide, cyclase, H-NOX, SIGNALING [Siphoviridae sp. ctUGR26]